MPDETKPAGETPEVTQPETNEASLPVRPAAEFLDRAKLELEIRLQTRQEYEGILEKWKTDHLVKLEQKQDEIIAKGLKEYFKKQEDERKPPSTEDIRQLLDQEYESFPVKVNYFVDGEDVARSHMFTLRELPQSVEKKFYNQVRSKLMDKMQAIGSIAQSEMERPFEDKFKAYLGLFDESFDILSEAVSLCLNPFGKKAVDGQNIDRDWVQANISSIRQWNIIEAQMKVNKLRDFFSKVSTSGLETTMTMRPNFRTLQQFVA